MSTAKRQSLHLDLSNAHNEELPQIAALFLILFDVRAGYVAANAPSKRVRQLRSMRIATR